MSVVSQWQPQIPIQEIVFDCDGTLSTLEGIDTLADQKCVGSEVKVLTEKAMGKLGMNPDLYRKRLEIVKPSQEQVIKLGELYYVNRTPDVQEVIQILNRLNKSVYIISAGLYPPVKIFGELLKVSPENIIAVDIQFDDEGNYKDFDHTSPLTHSHGKRILISEREKLNGRCMLIGDGLNDLVAKDVVSRFIGFGGNYYRENIAAQCQYYIKAKSMAALLPLVLTLGETGELTPAERELYGKGLEAIKVGNVAIEQS